MKPKVSLRFLFGCPIIALLAAVPVQAFTYYWDNDGTTAGFGAAGGTWAAPTTGGATQGWSTSATGVLLPGSVTTATTDTVNFGNGATGLASGSITVSGTVQTGNMTFASGSGAITLSGGTISLGGSRTITANNAGNIISSELALTGASTFRIGEIGSSATRQLTLGVLSGTGGTTFEYAGGTNGTGLIVLNGQSTYTGNTLISTTLTNANTQVRLDVDNALPTTTILTIGGNQGTGTSDRKTVLNLNGNDQTLAGLASDISQGTTRRDRSVYSTTAATLTINDSGNRTFAGTIGEGGTNVTIVKQGGGTWTLSGANTYIGLTTIDGGAINIQHATALGSSAAGTVVNGTGTAGTANARLELAGGITVSGESATISGVGNFNGALTSTSGANIWAGNVTIGAAGTRIGASAGASLEISGMIDSGVVNTGLIIRTADLTGSVILSGANTYLGNTQVLIGKLQLAGGDNRLPVGTTLTFGSSGTNPDAEFDLNGRNQEVAGLALTGTASKNSVNNSSLTGSTLTVNNASSSTYGGILKGNLGLTKTAGGTLTLTGNSNTYTGLTTVNGGTLALGADGTIGSTGGVMLGGGTFDVSAKVGGYTVNNLGGVGTVIGSLNVSAQLAIGNSPGTVDFENLTIAPGATYLYDLTGGGSTADLGNVSGTLTLTGALLDLVQLGTYTLNDKFTLFAYETGNLTGAFSGLADGTEFTDAGGLWKINYFDTTAGLNGGTGTSFVTITAIPEPAAALLGGLGALVMLRRRRA